MAVNYIEWWEIKSSNIQIKFTHSLDTDTLINDNLAFYPIGDSNNPLVEPFETINAATDYSSISRVLTLWFNNAPTSSGDYTLEFNNLKDFRQDLLETFSFDFDWYIESATPDSGYAEDLRPTRVPTEVEDYSIKSPSWTLIENTITLEVDPSSSLEITKIVPEKTSWHMLEANENDGRIDIYFSNIVASNFISPEYFTLEAKTLQKGLSKWVLVETIVLSNLQSTIISIFLPKVEELESSTPSLVYSNELSEQEIAESTFFEQQKRYRLTIGSEVGF